MSTSHEAPIYWCIWTPQRGTLLPLGQSERCADSRALRGGDDRIVDEISSHWAESRRSDDDVNLGSGSVLKFHGGAADRAGIRAGDVVTRFNGLPVTNRIDLTAQVRVLPGGTAANHDAIK